MSDVINSKIMSYGESSKDLLDQGRRSSMSNILMDQLVITSHIVIVIVYSYRLL